MIFHRRVIPILSVMVLLTGCAQPQTARVQNELGQINQKLRDLTNRAVALEQQNTLNANSTSGVYLLPAAHNRALLDSSIGKLSLELRKVEPEANGTRALLTIRTMNTLTLPAFQTQLDWGALDPVSGKPLAGDTQTQLLTIPPTLTPVSEITVEVRLSGLTPEQLGFVRVHDVAADPTLRRSEPGQGQP
ncbi:SadB/YajI family lipoprotein [Dickeya solani]|uniref:DUF3251 domain-containing protein n=1 Tax=Dickeya solani TaxID=1089444 RepID=A0ABU4ECE0_9GAMM|nr:DUF3251 domain-containing protein [Dickeya solani]MCA6997794.1 DUF3251 domain-containing protein [Dickeya solani]MCZ0819635.1 DUF3251 domain-containing protein [Dickeya solani]MDV6993454.1 DUF3251 domain-containing protein [Dickeya solani]MDV7003468.1 DUF3251 domain-containing protein [Dickeya solani]MDV7036303.1 DUF3251 domain-containing protein [Dickeya solani]